MCSSPYFRHFNETRNVVVLYTWMQVFGWSFMKFFLIAPRLLSAKEG